MASFPAFSEVKVGEPPPDIRLDALLPDQPVANATLHSLTGKVVVLEFWATWCKPCVAAIPHLNDLANKFKDHSMVFLSITDEEQPKVEAFLHEHPISGWIGIAHSTHLKEAYEVEGKLVGALHPEQLRSATLENLLAGKPVPFDLFPRHALPVLERSEGDAEPKALLDILVRPSKTYDPTVFRPRIMIRPGMVKMSGTTLSRIVSWSHEFWEERRIEGDAAVLTAIYDLGITISAPKDQDQMANVQRLRAMIRELIPVAFGVEVRRQTKDVDILVLTAPNGRPAALVEPTGDGTWETGDGKLEVEKCSLPTLASVLEDLLHRPVVDETGLSGEYDLKLTYDANAPDGLLNALRGIGLKVDAARRPIEFLVVTKTQ